MSYPYKYLVTVSNDDAYCSFEQVYKFYSIDDAMVRVKSAKEVGDRVAIYRIVQHDNFK